MHRAIRKTLATTGLVAAAAAGGSAIAGAAGGSDSSTRSDRAAERPLTGETGDKVKQAALARVEGGTIIRVETDADHGAPYEAHVRRQDGTEVEVLVNEDFEVTAVNEIDRPMGPGGHFGGPSDLIAALADGLGVSEAKVEAALEQLHEAREDELAAKLAKQLGLSADRVEKALEAARPQRP